MTTMPWREEAAAFILAGGRSSRMGSDKALALFTGRPMIETALATLRAAGLSAEIAGSRSPLAAFAPEIPDTWSDVGGSVGPLGGVYTALSATRADWNVFLTVDTPLMPPSLLVCLLERARLTGSPVTAISLNGRLEPFPVVLHRDGLVTLDQFLRSGQRACHAAWRAICSGQSHMFQPVAVEYLTQCGQVFHAGDLPPALWFLNANTPADLARLNHIAKPCILASTLPKPGNSGTLDA
jgi:molybdopterin-guanine dinucleotide biosynthesis protein A